MTGAITRGKANRADLALWDGINATSTRVDATGGTVTGLVIDDRVDVLQVYGSGTSRTKSSIDQSIKAIGSIREATLSFATGTWTITEDLTIPSNFASLIPRGCVFEVSSGKTLTFSGPIYAESSEFSSGGGSVVISADSIVSGQRWIAITEAEIAAGVTPTNCAYPPGDVCRFGAVGNGVTDCTNAINNAILVASQAATTGNSATVFIPSGIYIVSNSIRIREGVTLLGQGSTFVSGPTYIGTVIKAANSFNQPTQGIIENYSAQSGTDQEFCNIEKILVLGNRTGGAIALCGIRLDRLYINTYVRDVTVMECSGDGIRCTTQGGPIEIQNVWINGTDKHSLYINGNASSAFQYVRVRDVAFERWGQGTASTYNAICYDGGAGRDVARFLLVDGFYSEHANGQDNDCIRLINSSMVELRNLSGGSFASTGSLIRIDQTAGSQSWVYPVNSLSHGVICDAIYNPNYTNTIRDTVNTITRTDSWIPGWIMPEPMILIGTAGAPAFANSWVDRAGGYQAVGYLIDGEGWVCLFGGVKSGTVALTAFTLPAGARPVAGLAFAVPSNGAFGIVEISGSGAVTPIAPCNNTYVSLDGIRFKALA